MVILIVPLLLAISLHVQPAGSQRVLPPGVINPNAIFLEHTLIANGTVINGTVPFRSVNFPSYWFNANTGQLCGAIGFDINDSLLLIFGDSLTLRGNFGAGTGNKLYGIYSLPARVDQATVFFADRYGNLGLYAENRTMLLRPGQNFTYYENETVGEGKGIVRIAYQHQYTNRGLIPKGRIQTRMVA